jgi:hypothetical protein
LSLGERAGLRDGERGDRRLQQRTGQAGLSRRFGDDGELDVAQPEPAVPLGHTDREQVHLGEPLPEGVQYARFVAPADDVRRALRSEDRARQPVEGTLVVAQVEVHRSPFATGSRGSPSSRSAMMLRWISLVPAKIREARACQ